MFEALLTTDLARGLERQVVALRAAAGDPMLPIRVVVPTHLLGVALSRALFAGAGHVGIHFLLAEELAWFIAAPGALALGRTIIPEGADLALVIGAAADAVAAPATPEYLRAAAATAGFAPAALRTLRDLAGAGISADALEVFAPAAPDPDKLRVLARMFRAYNARLDTASLLERAALASAAAAALPRPELGAVVVCDVPDPSPAYGDLLLAIARHHPMALVLRDTVACAPRQARRRDALLKRLGARIVRDPAPIAATSLARMQAHLFGPRPAPQPLGPSVCLLSAPGEALEAVEIVRLVRDTAAAGTPFNEIAILSREPDSYAAHLASALERAGVPAFFVAGVPRVDPAARALGLLLALLDADLDRAQVMEFLTTAQVRYQELLGEDSEVSPARWDYLSARAGIVAGIDRWRAGLRAARDLRAEQDADARDVRLYDELGRLVELLHTDLAAFPQEGTWGELLAATRHLLDRWIQRGERTRERLERVLGPLDRYAGRATRAELLGQVHELIRTQTYREGALADARVFVGSIAAARGLRFRAVFVPGLVERRFPVVVRPDPLLLDEERAALSLSLLTTEDVQEAERLLFAHAALAATERLVLSYPRLDSSGREQVPSSFLLRAVEAALGERVSAERLVTLASQGETALGRPFPENADRAIDLIERDLALVSAGHRGAARHLLDVAPHLARSHVANRAGWEPRLTAHDGVVNTSAPGVDKLLARIRLDGRTSSASAAQMLGSCAYRYLLAYGLNVREWEEPGRTYELDALTVGSVYHAVAHELFEGLKADEKLPIDRAKLPGVRARAAKILTRMLAELASEGAIPHPSLLEPLADRLRADLDQLVEREVDGAGDFIPSEFELAFEDLEVELSRGRTVTLKGSIDRLDFAARPRRVRVIDYKTGGYYWKTGEEFRGGRALQLQIYNLAAAELYPKHEVTEASYYFATSKGEFQSKTCAATADNDATLRRVLGTLDDLVAAGTFPPVADDCGFCNFQPVCGPHREARAKRKSGDPRLVAFGKMREIL